MKRPIEAALRRTQGRLPISGSKRPIAPPGKGSAALQWVRSWGWAMPPGGFFHPVFMPVICGKRFRVWKFRCPFPVSGRSPVDFIPPFPVGDAQFVQTLMAARIFLRNVGITLSTRESGRFRDNVLTPGRNEKCRRAFQPPWRHSFRTVNRAIRISPTNERSAM